VPTPAKPVVAAPAKPAGPPPLRIRTRPEPPASTRPAPPPPPLDLAAIKSRLSEKKKEILAMYLNDLRSGQESNDSPTEDIVDRANNAYSRELNFSISDAERALLLQVEEALDRIESGAYGNCANCGQPIPRPRLAAIPWARYCIQCQEMLEQGLLAEG
jgi:DnaK suppressor protein